MSDNEPRERGMGDGGGRPDGEAPRTRFGGGAQGERPGGGDRPGGGRGPGGRGGPGGSGGPAAEADRVGVVVAASAGGARSADSASTRLGRSITRTPRACAATSQSEARSSRGASSARAPDTSVR